VFVLKVVETLALGVGGRLAGGSGSLGACL
jgi:hypothetical protein